jgi:peptidoglycan hydrolase CwlO-like protein
MRNLLLAIVVASLAILGFYAYQASRKVAEMQTMLEAKEAALITIESEKAALEQQLSALQTQVETLAAEAEAAAAAAASAPATEAPATEAPATNP